MSGSEYKRLLYKLGTEISGDPEIELDELKFICKERIPLERYEQINDVLTLLEELERSDNLGIDNLDFLKEVLGALKKHSCLEQVVEFETKRLDATLAVESYGRPNYGSDPGVAVATEDEGNLEARVGEAAEQVLVVATPGGFGGNEAGSASFGAVSTVGRAARSRLGALDIKCVYGIATTGILTVGAFYILKHLRDNPESIKAFCAVALPAGAQLIQLKSGCICLTVQAESLSALRALWENYENGSLQKSLEDLLLTDEIREMAGGESVNLRVSIDEDSYRNACLDLWIAEREDVIEIRKEEKLLSRRRMSDSFLLVKSPADTQLSPPDRLRLQRAELAAESERTRRDLLEKELDKFTQQEGKEEEEFRRFKANEYVAQYLEQLDLAGSSSGATESGYRTQAGSVIDQAEFETENSDIYGSEELTLFDLPKDLFDAIIDALTVNLTVRDAVLEAFGFPPMAFSWYKENDLMRIILEMHLATPVQLIRELCASSLDDDFLLDRLDGRIRFGKSASKLHLMLPLQELREMHVARVQQQPVTYVTRVRLVRGPLYGLVAPRLADELLVFLSHSGLDCDTMDYPQGFRLRRWRPKRPCLYIIIGGGRVRWARFAGNPVLFISDSGFCTSGAKEFIKLKMDYSRGQRLPEIFDQYRAYEDLWSMVKRYKAWDTDAQIASTLTSKVMLQKEKGDCD